MWTRPQVYYHLKTCFSLVWYSSTCLYSLFLTEQGSVYSCGWSADGQTGLGHYHNTEQISKCIGDLEGENIVKVSSSADCVLALNGKLVFFIKPFYTFLKSQFLLT